MSIPRVELNGVLLMAETYVDVYHSLHKEYDIEKVVFWTDSSVVHTWVNNKHKNYENYVQSRLNKIREVIGEKKFLLIPSKLNPADIGTRGLRPCQLVDCKLWHQGPDFLDCNKEFWPNLKNGDIFSDYSFSAKEEDVHSHTRLTSVNFSDDKDDNGSFSTNLNVVNSEYNVNHIIPVTRFSRLSKLLRATAIVLLFIKN